MHGIMVLYFISVNIWIVELVTENDGTSKLNWK